MNTKRQNSKTPGALGRSTFFAGLGVSVVALAISLGSVAYANTGFAVLAKVHIPADGAIAVNEFLNTVYTSGFNPAAQPIVVIDGRTFESMNVGTGSGVNVDVKTDRYWAATVFGGGVVVRNWANNVIATVPLSGCPIDTTYDFRFSRVWAGAQCRGGNDPVFAIDANTFHVIAGPIGSHGVMGSIIANGANGRLYLTSSGVSKRVNPITFALTSNAFGTVMAINTLTNRLYATSGNNLQIINGAPSPEVILTTIALPYTPNSMGINTELNHLYLANSAGNSIEVRDGCTGAPIAMFSLADFGAMFGAMTVDSIRGRIYVIASTSTGRVVFVLEDLTTARSSRANLAD